MLTDGVIVLRPPAPEDKEPLIALRDERFRRFIGEGSPDPKPTFTVRLAGDDQVVGWVDASYDAEEHTWLGDGEVNVGYALHPEARGRGAATRSVMLLLHHLARTRPEVHTATLAIDADNDRSLAIASRCGFTRAADLPSSTFWTKPVPPLTYTDGTVTIRAPRMDDVAAHNDAIDDVQIDWLWLPGQRESWEAMSPDEQHARQRRNFATTIDTWGDGPKWSFAIEVEGRYVGHVDCDLANESVPHGEANISYSSHPAVRGKGYVSRAVRLILRFVAEHTGAREAQIIVNPGNAASMRVPPAVGMRETERFVDRYGAPMVRHALAITR